MSGQVDPISQPSAWDVIKIANVTSPAVCKVGEFKRARDFDEKHGKGAIGSTLTIPLGSHSARDTITAIASLGIDTEAMTTRKPTLDDVYLQLTGSRLAA